MSESEQDTSEQQTQEGESKSEASDRQEVFSKQEPVTQDKSASEGESEQESKETESQEGESEEDDKSWFMKDKFENETEQAKAYSALLKKMGKNWGAPKDDYSLEGIEGVEADDPLLTGLKPALKDMGLSQEGFKSLVSSYNDALANYSKQIENEMTEYLKNSPEDAQTVRTVEKWINESFDEKDANKMKAWIGSVDDFKLLNKIRAHMPPKSQVPSSTANSVSHFETRAQVEQAKIEYKQAVKDGTKKPNKEFENELMQRFKDAYLRENAK